MNLICPFDFTVLAQPPSSKTLLQDFVHLLNSSLIYYCPNPLINQYFYSDLLRKLLQPIANQSVSAEHILIEKGRWPTHHNQGRDKHLL